MCIWFKSKLCPLISATAKREIISWATSCTLEPSSLVHDPPYSVHPDHWATSCTLEPSSLIDDPPLPLQCTFRSLSDKLYTWTFLPGPRSTLASTMYIQIIEWQAVHLNLPPWSTIHPCPYRVHPDHWVTSCTLEPSSLVHDPPLPLQCASR
jgi:hypothetical protein